MITDIQRFSLNDGPGIRTSVFMKGCPLSCRWCHNPEAIAFKPQILHYPQKCIGCGQCLNVCPTGALNAPSQAVNKTLCISCGACADVCYAGALVLSGEELSAREIVKEIEKDINYYKRSGGGVTITGGECLAQTDLSKEILRLCKEIGISTAIETSLYCQWDALESLLPLLDLIMLDIKLADADKHAQWTGVSNQLILANLKRLSAYDIPLIIRTPVISGVNDMPEDIAAIARIIYDVPHLLYYELLNYNPLGESKYEALGARYVFKGLRPLSNEIMAKLSAAAEKEGVKRVKIG